MSRFPKLFMSWRTTVVVGAIYGVLAVVDTIYADIREAVLYLILGLFMAAMGLVQRRQERRKESSER